MEKQQKISEEEEKVYKNPVLYLRKSKKGNHLYAFNIQANAEASAEGLKDRGEMVLGNNIDSLLLNVSDVVAVISGTMDWCKVSVLVKEDGDLFPPLLVKNREEKHDKS